MQEKPLWSPSAKRVADAQITRFAAEVGKRHRVRLADYHALWQWSISHLEEFWTAMWDFGGVISGPRGRRVLVQGDMMPGARFFPDVRLNFAENLLRGNPEGDAIVFWGEDKVKRRLTHRELREAVSRMQQALVKAGVKEGDRVAAFMPNMPETVIAMLAIASLGGTFTSCSPDSTHRSRRTARPASSSASATPARAGRSTSPTWARPTSDSTRTT
jgi:acetoacetyl-CoA synthetase